MSNGRTFREQPYCREISIGDGSRWQPYHSLPNQITEGKSEQSKY